MGDGSWSCDRTVPRLLPRRSSEPRGNPTGSEEPEGRGYDHRGSGGPDIQMIFEFIGAESGIRDSIPVGN